MVQFAVQRERMVPSVSLVLEEVNVHAGVTEIVRYVVIGFIRKQYTGYKCCCSS